MGSDLKRARIGELFELVNGFAFKSKDFIDDGIPVIKIKNVKAGFFSEHEFSYLAEEFLDSRPEKLAKQNDLLTDEMIDMTPTQLTLHLFYEFGNG